MRFENRTGNVIVDQLKNMSDTSHNKVIVFDLDGVLFNSLEFAEREFLKNYPGTTPQMYKNMFLGNYHEEYRKHKIPRIAQTEEEHAEYKKWYAENKALSPLYAGVKELITRLYEDNYILVVNTSSYTRTCAPLLERSGISDFFDFQATVEVSKSKVDKFKIIKERYFVADNADILFVTDTVGDIREASEAEIPTVAVTWGLHGKSDFDGEKNSTLVGIVDSATELEVFINNYFNNI